MSVSFTGRYEPDIETPSVARHELERWLPSSLGEPARATLRLLVSELVTNSVRHGASGGGAVGLDARLDGGTIRVEVSDGGTGFRPGKPVPRDGSSGFGGYGLFLVERMASRWGVDDRDGTRVWFELDLGRATG